MKVLTTKRRCVLVVRDLLVFTMVSLGTTVVLSGLLGLLINALSVEASGLLYLILMQAVSVGSLFAAYGVMRLMRSLPSPGLGLSIKGRAGEMLGGFLMAGFLYATGFGLSLALGWIRVESVNAPDATLFFSWFFFFLVALNEEALLRGVVLGKLLDGGISKMAALLLSSVLFSVLHLFNPNFSLLPFLNLILAGILLGASYIYTRNLWFPIFLHWFWNWLQGPVLGYGVSGMNLGDAVVTLGFNGPDWLSGSVFGFEGTLLCTLLMVVATALIIRFFRTSAS